MGLLSFILNNRQAVPKGSTQISSSFRADFEQLNKLAAETNVRFELNYKDVYPCLGDKTDTTAFDRHYVYHPAWAARILRKTTPSFHIDISSTLYFSAIVSAFIPIKFYDYRPADLRLTDLSSAAADLMCLPFGSNSIESLSCMHTVEHIGLGRYGDPLDYDGDLKAIKELKRVVAPRGSLLFVVPIGQPKLIFNAHRIYSYDQVTSYFSDFELVEFSLIPDDPEQGGLVERASVELANRQTYGCGCFWFRKKP